MLKQAQNQTLSSQMIVSLLMMMLMLIITNEMLKKGSAVLKNALKLFNHIFNDGNFPSY